MLIICIIIIIVGIIIASQGSQETICPKCGSADISTEGSYGSPLETGIWAILACIINPASAQSYAKRSATSKYHHKCRKCGHQF